MKSRPILFSAPMIRAILSGAKTQTRRVLTPALIERLGLDHVAYAARLAPHVPAAPIVFPADACPYGMPSDRLWCKETHSTDALTVYPCPPVWYRADCGMYDDPADGEHSRHCDALRTGHPRADCYACAMSGRRFRWKPSIFMPRKLSRITLEIAEVRVQRLQEISEDDARAEGIHEDPPGILLGLAAGRRESQFHATTRDSFADLWDRINGRRRVREYLQVGDPGYTVDRPWRTVIDESSAWAANPWVWCLTFRRVP